MQFRKDINGLRALAVLPVLLFHSGWETFSGGFLGVDVFFVISGYLITSLIIKEIDTGTFSILAFYDRRARRILPALLVTCILTTMLSFFLMLPYDLKNFGQSLVATVLSANNILLYLTSGYWSLAAEFKPLYHTWSLAVEEQYYVIIPALILAIYTLSRAHIKNAVFLSALAFLFFISYWFSFSSENKEFNFLIVSHRMWELLAGSIVATYMFKRTAKKNDAIAFAGVSMIVASYLWPNALSNNQAVYNVFPVLGVVLIIIFSSNESIVGRILSVKPLYILGLCSYSIYLLHMPILAFLRLASENKPTVWIQVAFVSISIPMAYLMWRFIEKYFRDSSIVGGKNFYSLLSLASVFLLATGLLLNSSYGLQSYFKKYNYGNNPQRYADVPYGLARKDFADDGRVKLLVIGNSFARDFINMLVENRIAESHEIIYLYDINENFELSEKLAREADVTVSVSSCGMAGKFDPDEVSASSKLMYDFLRKYTNGSFLRIGTKNFGWNNNFVRFVFNVDLSSYNVKVNLSTLEANKIEKKIWGDKYIDLIEMLSNDGERVPLFTPRGEFISFDTEHVTKAGAVFLGEVLLSRTKLKEFISL